GAVGRLQPIDFARHAGNRVSVGDGAETARCRRIALEGRQQAIRVRALEVALDALRAEHAAIERKLVPGLEADDLVVLDLQLDAALLPAEAAMRLDQPFGLDAGGEPYARHRRHVGAEVVDDL